MDTNLGLILTNRARNSRSLEAFVDCGPAETRISYTGLDTMANKAAHVLLALGLQSGDRIALLQQNCAEFVALFFGAAKIGVVTVPLNTRLTAPELAFIVGDSGAKLLVSDAEFDGVTDAMRDGGKACAQVGHWLKTRSGGADCLQTLLDEADAAAPDAPTATADNLFIMYTSGTTGQPKGVVHTHASMLAAAGNWLATVDVRYRDRIFLPLPMFHVAALNCVIFSVLRGITIVSMPSFDPAKAWDLMAQERITIAGSVPAVLNFMRQVPSFETFDSAHFRFFITGAAPMPAPLIEIYNNKGMEVVQGYALTESGGGGSFLMNEYALSKIGSAGTPSMYTELRVMLDDGSIAMHGTGEVLMRGPHMMKEYWNRPEATVEAWIEGWFRTGDIAEIDGEGFVYIKDRIKDMIISGGENIYPAEVESVLQGHAAVREVAVIGLPDERWGESVCAVVSVSEPIDGEDLVAFCAKQLSRYKLPRSVQFVEALPRNAAGKVLKAELRQRYLADE